MTDGGSGAALTREQSAAIRLVKARAWFTAAALAMLAFFGLTLLNAFLAGGRMGLRDDRRWDEIAAWALLPLPAWLVIAVAAIAPLAVIAMIPNLRPSDAPYFVSVLVLTLVCFIGFPVLFGGVYTSVNGLPMDFTSYPEEGWGWHWIGAVLQIPTLLAVLIGFIVASRSGRRNPAEAA